MFDMSNYPLNVLGIYQEYLDLTKFYLNSKTNSVPVRYLNVDIEQSVYDEEALVTFDQFNKNLSGIVYNLYEFTPVFYTSPIVNMTTNETDKDFSRFSSIFTIQTYTIPKIYIGDLVHFYAPNNQKQVLYRVVNFRVPLNTFENVPIYELDLEPAPVITEVTSDNILVNININKRYIYDYSIEQYLPFETFELKVKIRQVINQIYKQYLNSVLTSKELIITDGYIFYEINKWLFESISLFNKKFRHLDIPIPFGYMNLKVPKNPYNDTYIDLNNNGGQLNYLNKHNTYEQLIIHQQNIDFNDVISQIQNSTFDLDTYPSDIQKQLILLYLIDKLRV